MNFYTDSDAWKFLVKNSIRWDEILPLYITEYPTADGFKNQEEVIAFYEDLLTNTGEWAGTKLAARAKEIDAVGSGTLKDDAFTPSEPLLATYREATELGLFGLTVSAEHGGMGLPSSVGMLTIIQVFRACLASGIQLSFFTGIADMLERFAPKEIAARLIPQIVRGELSGSMCLTEPGAGSDVGALKTKAIKQADGTYLLTGSKIFISNGGGGLGFILARIEGAPEGLAGVSLFLAEEWITDSSGAKKHNYRITKLEEKLGLHGSATCEVVYENTVAHLIGEEHRGFTLMLHLMNEARIAVGLQGLAGIEACLDHVKRYAETRVQFGKPIQDLPLYARNVQDMETERDAIRVLMVEAMSAFDVYQRLDLKKRHTGELTDAESKLYNKGTKKLRLLTPLVKYYGSEAFATISQKTIQAFGGYGFIKEYEVERFHRDCFGLLLYEGTSQIQSLMALKDFMKFTFRDPRKFLQSILKEHPIGALMRDDSPTRRSVRSMSYEFNKQLAMLLFKTLIASEFESKDLGLDITRLSKAKLSLLDPKKIDRLMTHAETFCQGLSYLETLKAISKLADKSKEMSELYYRYQKLVTPRLAAIYSDWKIR